MSTSTTQQVIESALREPENYTPRRSIHEPAIAWQARAVLVALTKEGIVKL